MVASVEIAYVVRDTAADHPGLTAPARIIGMRSQGEAEIAIEQGETRYEGVTWATRRQRASNQLIPLPEPARRGLINLADDVAPFVGPKGGALSSANFGADVWRPAVTSVGLRGFTFHGLRGVSATLAARQGATTKELSDA